MLRLIKKNHETLNRHPRGPTCCTSCRWSNGVTATRLEIPRQWSPWLGRSLGMVPECNQSGERCSFENLSGWHLSHVHQGFNSADPPREISILQFLRRRTWAASWVFQEIQPRTRIVNFSILPTTSASRWFRSRATIAAPNLPRWSPPILSWKGSCGGPFKKRGNCLHDACPHILSCHCPWQPEWDLHLRFFFQSYLYGMSTTCAWHHTETQKNRERRRWKEREREKRGEREWREREERGEERRGEERRGEERRGEERGEHVRVVPAYTVTLGICTLLRFRRTHGRGRKESSSASCWFLTFGEHINRMLVSYHRQIFVYHECKGSSKLNFENSALQLSCGDPPVSMLIRVNRWQVFQLGVQSGSDLPQHVFHKSSSVFFIVWQSKCFSQISTIVNPTNSSHLDVYETLQRKRWCGDMFDTSGTSPHCNGSACRCIKFDFEATDVDPIT